eukprot:6141579-Pyramimonas_sp.AAC.1
MAGAPADSEATIPATEEEMQMMLHPQVVGNPINIEPSGDDPWRGSPRDAGDLSERTQCELEHSEDHHLTVVASGRSPSRHGRSAGRQDWRRTSRSEDD